MQIDIRTICTNRQPAIHITAYSDSAICITINNLYIKRHSIFVLYA